VTPSNRITSETGNLKFQSRTSSSEHVDAKVPRNGDGSQAKAIGSLDRSIIGPFYRPMEILTLSQVKPRIGRLIERALAGEAVVIRKGNRLVQLTEYVVPEPIPERPLGYFGRRAQDYRVANRAEANHLPQR
jgi:hypothetical protein